MAGMNFTDLKAFALAEFGQPPKGAEEGRKYMFFIDHIAEPLEELTLWEGELKAINYLFVHKIYYTTKIIMKTTLFLLISILFLSCQQTFAQQPTAAVEKTRVIALFDQYKEAVATENGRVAVHCISSNSITYYEQVLDHVLHANKEKLLSLPSGDLMQVLALRRAFPKTLLITLDGRKLYQTMIEHKFTEEEQLAQTTLGYIAFRDNEAKAQMILRGKPSSVFFYFVKEDDQWKLDLTTTVEMTSTFVENKARDSQLSVPDFLEAIMQLSEEEKILIWQPLK